LKYFSTKGFDGLLDEMNLMDGDGLLSPAAALLEIFRGVSPERMIKEIMDTSNSEAVRVTLIQINEGLDNDSVIQGILPLLDDENTPYEMKINILLASPTDVELYARLATGTDDVLAFQALQLLFSEEPETAMAIIDEIFADFHGA